MGKQKIALVNVFFPPQSVGGATRVLVDNFNTLQKKYADDFELVVFTSDLDMQDAPHRLDSYIYKGVRVYRSSVIFREHMDWHSEDHEMGILFEKFLDFEKPDKVHFHCVQRLSGSIVEKTMEKKIPYFITLHDAWWISDFQFLVDLHGKVYPNGHTDPYEKIALPEGIDHTKSLKRKIYLTNLLGGAEKLFSVSKSFEKLYRKNGIGNIVVTGNGISDSVAWRQKDTSDHEKVVCGHIGNISEHKGYDILKKAVFIAQPENLEFLFVDHSQEEGYIARETWGSVPVTFIGSVKQEHIVDLYGKIDVLFAPSIWPESFGLVTREAAACGCWVVASSLGGIGEDVIDGKTGFVIKPKVKKLIEVLETIDSDREKYKLAAPSSKIRYASEQADELVHYYKTVKE